MPRLTTALCLAAALLFGAPSPAPAAYYWSVTYPGGITEIYVWTNGYGWSLLYTTVN